MLSFCSFSFVKLALIVKEMSALSMMDDDQVRLLMRSCGEMGRLHCCCELLKIQPVPFYHPIMSVLQVTEIVSITCFNLKEIIFISWL